MWTDLECHVIRAWGQQVASGIPLDGIHLILQWARRELVQNWLAGVHFKRNVNNDNVIIFLFYNSNIIFQIIVTHIYHMSTCFITYEVIRDVWLEPLHFRNRSRFSFVSLVRVNGVSFQHENSSAGEPCTTVCPWKVLTGLSWPSLHTWMHMSVLQEANVLLLCQSTSRAGAVERQRQSLGLLQQWGRRQNRTWIRWAEECQLASESWQTSIW